MLTTIGLIATGLVIYTRFLIGKKKRIAFVIDVIGCLLWIYVSIERTPVMLDLALANFVFAGLSIRNFILWGEK